MSAKPKIGAKKRPSLKSTLGELFGDPLYEKDPSYEKDPELGRFENELLWILNQQIPANLPHQASLQSIQQDVRVKADGWIKKPRERWLPRLFGGVSPPYAFRFQWIPQPPLPKSKPWDRPALRFKIRPEHEPIYSDDYWSSVFNLTLTQWAADDLRKCPVCGKYFIDKRHRRKMRCSQRCTWLALQRETRQRRKK